MLSWLPLGVQVDHGSSRRNLIEPAAAGEWEMATMDGELPETNTTNNFQNPRFRRKFGIHEFLIKLFYFGKCSGLSYLSMRTYLRGLEKCILMKFNFMGNFFCI